MLDCLVLNSLPDEGLDVVVAVDYYYGHSDCCYVPSFHGSDYYLVDTDYYVVDSVK